MQENASTEGTEPMKPVSDGGNHTPNKKDVIRAIAREGNCHSLFLRYILLISSLLYWRYNY